MRAFMSSISCGCMLVMRCFMSSTFGSMIVMRCFMSSISAFMEFMAASSAFIVFVAFAAGFFIIAGFLWTFIAITQLPNNSQVSACSPPNPSQVCGAMESAKGSMDRVLEDR